MDQESGGRWPPETLAPSPERFREMAEEAVRLIAAYYGALDELPVAPRTSSAGLRAALSHGLPREGDSFEALLDEVREVVVPGSRHNAHRRFFGYVASPAVPVGVVADLLASALDPTVTAWRSAPAATEVERLTLGWIAEILGYPAEAQGVFVSGGSMANLCGIAAARDARAPGDVTATGLRGMERALRLYASEEAHFSIAKAAGLLGIGRDHVRSVPVTAERRMDLPALVRLIEEDLAAGHLPFCVVASLGTVNTGAVDPLDEVADVASRFGLWLHVDAAYGGFAALAPSARHFFRGLARADSVALDPHKWLYVPVDCGCVLYRDPASARAVFAQDAEYTRVLGREADESFAFWDYTPELTRRFRALKVWMVLRHVGTAALGEAVERNLRCAEQMARLVEDSPDFEMAAPVGLSIFCFRCVPPQLRAEREGAAPHRREEIEHELDALNERILLDVQRRGRSYLSNARLDGRFVLRGCVLNYRTTARDMEILLEDCRDAARRSAPPA